MKKILPFLLFFICIHAYTQSIKKANKFLDAGEFQNAETEFNLVREKDSLNPELWLGYAMLYSNEKFSPHNFFKAYEFVQKSRDLYYALDSKGKNKLSKSYSIDSVSQHKLIIDKKLFNYLKFTDDIALYNKYLTDCKKGVYVKQITELRNANAFKTTAMLNTLEAYKDFIANYPGASQISTAVTKRDQLAFKQTIEKNTIQAYDEYLTEYKYSTYVNTAVGLKNELLFLGLLDSPSKDSINAFIGLMQQQNPKPQHLIDCSNKLLKILDAQNDWIIYLSDSNLYKMNQVDYKITQLTNSGDILSFAISPKGDMAYLKQKDEKTVEIFKFNIDGKASKICDHYIKNGIHFTPNFNTFEISDDFSHIRIGLGFNPGWFEPYSGLWSANTNTWEVCTDSDIMNDKCKTDFSIVKYNTIEFIRVNSKTNGMITVKKINGVNELFIRTTNQKITSTKQYDRNDFTGADDSFAYNTCGYKIFFYFSSTCGDFCYGPFFIVNLDGTYQRFLYDARLWTYTGYHAWDYNGDLIVLSTEFENSDNINALCLFYGYENNKKVLAKNVDMFRIYKSKNSYERNILDHQTLLAATSFVSTKYLVSEILQMYILENKVDCNYLNTLLENLKIVYKDNTMSLMPELLNIFTDFDKKFDGNLMNCSNLYTYTGNDTFMVDLSGNLYTTIKIGSQLWLAENLKYLPDIHRIGHFNKNAPSYYVYDYNGSSIYDAKNTENYKQYGVLYNFEAAQISCPPGWHLPSDQDWKILESFVGMTDEQLDIYEWNWRGTNQGCKLAGCEELWAKSINLGNLKGDKTFGSSLFNAIPGGFCNTGSYFADLGSWAYFWTSSLQGGNGIVRFIGYDRLGIGRETRDVNFGVSIRCIKDN
jgi:uncharacterized protein (TIGR02145 family)